MPPAPRTPKVIILEMAANLKENVSTDYKVIAMVEIIDYILRGTPEEIKYDSFKDSNLVNGLVNELVELLANMSFERKQELMQNASDAMTMELDQEHAGGGSRRKRSMKPRIKRHSLNKKKYSRKTRKHRR